LFIFATYFAQHFFASELPVPLLVVGSNVSFALSSELNIGKIGLACLFNVLDAGNRKELRSFCTLAI